MLDLYLDEMNHEQYTEFIDYIFKKSDRISFHFPDFDAEEGAKEMIMHREYARYLKKCEDVIDFMWPYKIEERISNEYGISEFGYMTKVWVIRLENSVVNYLKEKEHFFEWQYSNGPEDLCFYKKGTSKCWMATVAHEKIAQIYGETAEDIQFLDKLQIPYGRVRCLGIFKKKIIPDYKKMGEGIQKVVSLEQFWKSIDEELEKPMTLCEACERGEYQVVEKLIQEGADVNTRDESDTSLLELAILSFGDWECNSESYKIVKMLVKNGADVNYRNSCNNSIREMVTTIFVEKIDKKKMYDKRLMEIAQIYQMFVELTGEKPTFSEAVNAACVGNLFMLEYMWNVAPEVFDEVDCEGKNIIENVLDINEGEEEIEDIEKVIRFLEKKIGHI